MVVARVDWTMVFVELISWMKLVEPCLFLCCYFSFRMHYEKLPILNSNDLVKVVSGMLDSRL